MNNEKLEQIEQLLQTLIKLIQIKEQNILNDYEQGIEEIGCRLRLSSCERRCLSDDCPRLVA